MLYRGRVVMDHVLRVLISLGLVLNVLGNDWATGVAWASSTTKPVTQQDRPTPTPTESATLTTQTTATATVSATATEISTALSSATKGTPEPKLTQTPSTTPTPTPLQQKETETPTEVSVKPTLELTASPEPSSSPTQPTVTVTSTDTETATPTATETATGTAEPTATSSASPSPTATKDRIELTSLVPAELPLAKAVGRSAADGVIEQVAEISQKTGGAVLSADDRILLVVDPGVLSQDVSIVMRAEIVSEPPSMEEGLKLAEALRDDKADAAYDATVADPIFVQYRIEAQDPATGKPITDFKGSIKLYFDLRDMRTYETHSNWYIVYKEEDEKADLWHKVATTILDDTGLIGTETNHLSIWNAGDTPGAWKFDWLRPSVSEFNGAVNYTYPIEEPPGRGGLQPNVDLSYSSAGVNNLTLPSTDQGLLGQGWSIADEISISRTGSHPHIDYGLYMHYWDTFQLTLNGRGYDLVAETESTAQPYTEPRVISRVAKLTGSSTNWGSTLTRTYPNWSDGLTSGQSVTFRMKLPDASNYTLVSMIAQDTEYYRRFGLYSHGGQIYFQYTNGGPNQEGCASPSHPFTPYSNFWYVVTLTVDDANGMRAEIYEESQPTNRMSCSVALQSGRAWRFRAWTYQTGHTLYIDDYNESTGAGWHDNFDASDTSKWAYSGLNSQQVVPFEDVNTARFYADNGPGVFITRVYAQGSTRSGLNLDKVFWVVKTNDGKTYRLGFSDEATYFQHGADIQWLDCTGDCSTSCADHCSALNTGRGASDWVGVRWLVDNIWDTHLNRIAYQYRTTYANAPYTPLTDRSDFLIVRGAPFYDQFTSTVITDLRRLSRIDYNFDITYGTTPASRIEFVDAGSDWGGLRASQINIYHTNLTTPIRSIALGLGNLTTHCNNGDCVSTDYITTLQLKNGGTVLPRTTFGYDIKNETTPIVRAITNGYGGRAEFTYQDDNRWEDHQAGRFPRWARSYFVTSMRESADYYPSASNVDIPIGTPTWAITTRTYQTPCFDQTAPEDTYTNNWGNLPGRFNCPTRRSVPSQEYGNGPLVGFQTVTTERFNANGRQLAKVVTTFFQGWPDNANILTWIAAGQVKQVKAYDAQGQVVSQTDNTYGVPTYSPSGYQGGAIFVFLQTTDEALAGATTKHTVYEYDTAYQGNQQFGNLTGTYENNDSNGAYRNPFARFYPNTARWIVGLPGWQGVRRWTGAQWQYETSTCLSYDWHAACQSAIDGKGELVAVRQAGNPDPTDGIVAGTQFRDQRYWYDAYGQVTLEATYPYSGTQTWYAYNAATGNVITTTYDSTYRIYPVSVINPAGQETTLDWHWSYSVPKWIQDANGIRSYFYVDAFGRVWRVLRSPDSTFTVDYVYGDTNVASLSSPLSITTKQATVAGVLNEPTLNTYAFFDGFGRQIQSRSPVENQNQQAVTNIVYDALDRAVASYVPALESSSATFSRPSGWETRSHAVTSYDWLGRALEQADPNGATTSLSYLGRTSIAVDANGHRDDSNVDVFGRTTSITEGTSEPTTFEAETLYTTLSNTTIQNGSRISPAVSGGHTNLGYLTYGPYQVPQVAGAGQVVRFRLAIDSTTGDDSPVATLEVTDYTAGVMLAQRTIYRGDFQGIQDGQSGLSNFRDFSLVFSTEGRAGHALEYRVYWLDYARMAHDKTLVTWSGGNTTTYGYSALDQLSTVTQGASTITVHYNALGEKDYMIDPDMGKWVYGYNELGQLITQTDNRGCVTTLTYDKLSRIRTKAYTGSGACGTTPAVTYTYDAGTNNVGHRTRMDDGSGWTQWAYDTRGRLQTETRYISLLNQAFTTQYEYNPMDQIKRILMPNGEWVAYTYEQGTLNAVTSQEGSYSNQSYMTSMGYDVAGRLTGMTYGNGVATTFTYYNWFTQGQGGRLQTQTAGSGNSIQNFGYTYDYVGNIKTLTDGTNSSQVQSFGYDAQDRLTTAGANGVGIDANYSQSFTYLANGNMETANTSYLGGVTRSYAYSATASSCQQAPALTHAVSAVGTVATYSYDCNGNMTNRSELRSGTLTTYTQTWDAENRLKFVSTGVQTTTFTYDGDNARVLQQRPDGYTSVYVNRFLEIAINQATPTVVPTNTPTSTVTQTPTRTQTPVAATTTSTPTRTPTRTVTATSTATRTATPTGPTPTSTRTATVTPSPTATTASACPGNSLVTNGCFETGNLTGWETYSGSPSVTTAAKYSGTYGANYPNGSALRQDFTTVSGQTYTVSARLRIDSQSGSDWGGYRVQITDYNWSDLGQSAYYTTANSPLGTWTWVTFTFTAVSTQSRIEVSQFTGPSLSMIGDWDEIAVVASSGAAPKDLTALEPTGVQAEQATLPLVASKSLLRPVSDSVTQRLAAERRLEAVRAWATAWSRWLSVGGTEPTLIVRHKALARPTALLSPGAGQTYRVSYFAGSRLVAVREVGVKNSLNFMHLDHLGSPSGATNGTNPQLVAGSTTRYYPFGMPRPGFSGGQSFTDAAFTGQVADVYTGLMYYNARYYDVLLHRFVQPDSIVPDPFNPQDANRFGYVRNNPVNFTDKSGRCIDGVSTIACVLIIGALVLKVVDYGWTAYDTVTSAQTVADPSASLADKILAGANIILAVGLEALEPDDYIPVSVPADDVVRVGLRQGLERALKEGGVNAALRYLQKEAGPSAIRALFDQGVFGGIKSFREWDTALQGVRDGAGLQVHHLIESRWAEILGITDTGLIPSVVIDSSVHNGSGGITQMLMEAAKGRKIETPQQLWEFYKEMYRGQQDWLDAMWPFFAKLGVTQ